VLAQAVAATIPVTELGSSCQAYDVAQEKLLRHGVAEVLRSLIAHLFG
jgi:hypothetical protein